MRVFAAVSLLVALTAGAQVPVELSDLLTSSPLVTCAGQPRPAATAPARSRIVTWNIHAARQAPLDQIAAELTAMQADVIALQEVDVRVRRTDFVDEPVVLAATLGYRYVFAASIKWDEGDYGLAVLSRWPLTNVRRYRLDATSAEEPRIVLEVTVCAPGRSLHIFNHHADGRAASRETGFSTLREIVRGDVGHGVLVLGDFNEHADGSGLRSLVGAGLVDLGAARNVATADEGRIDYVLADDSLARRASAVRVWRTDKSDHNAVLADLEW